VESRSLPANVTLIQRKFFLQITGEARDAELAKPLGSARATAVETKNTSQGRVLPEQSRPRPRRPRPGRGRVLPEKSAPRPPQNPSTQLRQVRPADIMRSTSSPAAVVLLQPRALRQIAAGLRDAPLEKAPATPQATSEDSQRALVDAAARHGLTAKQLQSAVRSFANTFDPRDRGIATYVDAQYARSEELLTAALARKERDPIEILRYLGAAHYQQAKYRAAADSFRQALELRGDDPILLSWLARSLYNLAEWAKAEPLLRRALAIDEKNYGPDDPTVRSRSASSTSPCCSRTRTASPRPSRCYAARSPSTRGATARTIPRSRSTSIAWPGCSRTRTASPRPSRCCAAPSPSMRRATARTIPRSRFLGFFVPPLCPRGISLPPVTMQLSDSIGADTRI